MSIRIVFAALSASVGFLIGVAFSLTVFVSVYSSKGIIEWIYRWQTLIAGLFAIFAAAATVAAIVWQSRESTRGVEAQLDATERAKRDVLARRRIATLALMPAVLDEMVEYITRCGIIIKESHRLIKSRASARPRVEEPELPRHALQDLKELIENLEPDEAHVVADLLSAYQVNSARMKSFIGRYNKSGYHLKLADIESLTIKCAEVKLRCDSIFPFARREVERLSHPKFDEKMVMGALHLLDINDAMTDGWRKTLVSTLTRPAASGHIPHRQAP